MANPVHWVARAARAAGLPGAERLEVDPRTPASEAWEAVLSSIDVPADRLAQAVADWFRLDVADLSAADPVVTKLVPGTLARSHQVFPVAQDDRSVIIATADPVDVTAEQQIGFASGRTPVFRVAPPAAIAAAIESVYAPERAVENLLDRLEPGSEAQVTLIEEEEEDEEHTAEPTLILDGEGDDGPIIRLANMILEDAVKSGASDIHLQPLPTGGVIRLRIDGVLRSNVTVPLAVLAQVISRIKIISRLDISDRMRPQDGRARIRINDQRYDLRVSTVPVRGGEKCVIRILDPGQSRELDTSGLPEAEITRLRKVLRNRDGILVITGPTGSGKTTTMYAALREISSEDVNIMTVEDPVEYELPGLTQIQVDPKKGVTFHSALKAILRQDPDVIFVGEIRDEATAEMAAQASLTGHLVLATVHANDAVGSIRRFLDLGLDPGTISETLRAALAQRLVRTLCATCALPAEGALDPAEEEFAQQFQVRPTMRAVGCDECGNSGYRGRQPVVELLAPSAELLQLVAEEASHVELTRRAVGDGMRPLLESALDLVREGVTTLSEVVRVIGDEAISVASSESAIIATEEAHRTPEATGPASPAPSPPRSASGAAVETHTRAQAVPALERRTTEDGDIVPPNPRHARLAEDPEPLGPPRVLVVDDDEDQRFLLRSILESHGWVVDEASDGKEALLLIGRLQGLSLIILDLGLPDIDGLDVLRTAKGNLATAGIPLLVLTGHTDQETERTVLSEGADDYLRKPIDPAIFLMRSKGVMRRHSARSA